VPCLGQKFWIPKQSKTPTVMWLKSSAGNVFLFFVFWWHHMVVGSTLRHVTMLFFGNSENSHLKHSKAIYITSNIPPHSPGYFRLCQIIVSITK
jgi:hypothetical protein